MPIIPPPGDTTSDTAHFPLETVAGSMGVSTKGSGSTGLGSLVNYYLDASPIVAALTVLNWKLVYFGTLGSGVTAKLRVYDRWNGGGNYVETNLSAGLNSVTITGDAAQIAWLEDSLPFGGDDVSAAVNVTAGTNGASARIISLSVEMTGWYASGSLYSWGYPAPTDLIYGTADWITNSGPPMQAQPVTLMWLSRGRWLNRNDPQNVIVRIAHTVTNGSGGFNFTYRDWAGHAWLMPGWWYNNRATGQTPQWLKAVMNANIFDPVLLEPCTSPFSHEIYSPALYAGPNRDISGVWCFRSDPGPHSGAYVVGTLSTDYRPKIHATAFCNDGGRYNLDGVTLLVTGQFGTESVVTGSDGLATLVDIDPQAILDVAITAGAPACGAMNAEPPYTTPTGRHRTEINPGLMVTGSELRTGAEVYTPARVAPACGDHWWEGGGMIVCASCGGSMPSMRLNVDSHDPTGQIAVAWINDRSALKVCVNPEPATCLDLSDGGAGWTNTVTLEAANASDVGLVFLPNGRLYVCYDLSGAKKYRTTDQMAHGAAGTWSAAATPSPALSRHSDQGRAQAQAFRFRATGGSPDPWTGSGDVKFSQDRENTGAEWTTEVTVASGSRGLFCGGSWIGQGYGCLYTKESDGLVYWITSENPDSWSGTGTQIAAITKMPVSLARHSSGVLVALCWDATGTKGTRAARSNDRGVTWSFDSADIASIPPLTQPPLIVCTQGVFYAVWVAADQAMCAFSADEGQTWEG